MTNACVSSCTGLRRVRTITDRFLQAIIQSLPKMPYPIRYIAQQMLQVLKVGPQ